MEEEFSVFEYWKYVLVLVISIGTLYIWRWKTKLYSTFQDMGIDGPEPTFPFGNLWGTWKVVIPDYDTIMHKKYGKTYGYFDGLTPVLYTTDPQIIRNVFVKDFDNFINRRGFNFETKYFRKFMTIILGREWKAIRTAISPAFSSGKIKRMSLIMTECSQRLVSNLKRAVEENKGNFEAKDRFGTYTMDVIASCCFGMNIHAEGAEENPFVKYASTLFGPKSSQKPSAVIPFMLPTLTPIAINRMAKLAEWKFFIKTAETLVRQRIQSKVAYNDFVEMALEAVHEASKNGNLKEEDIEEIVVSQSLLFFLAGYDTTGTAITLTSYNLALHQEVQQRLYEQIVSKVEENNGILDHTVANSIEYLDHVINETLRMYPSVVRVERQCNKDVQYGNLKIPKGMVVAVPLVPLHQNPDSFPDPEKFDPDRWSAERKSIIHPNSYMPFGAGPRNCIGMRFALEEIKLALCAVIKEFQLGLSEKSEVPITFPPGFSGLLQPRDVYLKVESRS